MFFVRAWRVVDPVEDNERQTPDHEENPHDQEDGGLQRQVEEEEEESQRLQVNGASLWEELKQRRSTYADLLCGEHRQ